MDGLTVSNATNLIERGGLRESQFGSQNSKINTSEVNSTENSKSFSATLNEAIQNVNQLQKESDTKAQELDQLLIKDGWTTTSNSAPNLTQWFKDISSGKDWYTDIDSVKNEWIVPTGRDDRQRMLWQLTYKAQKLLESNVLDSNRVFQFKTMH